MATLGSEAKIQPVVQLGEIGLENYPPYLMNRIMGRFNASLRDDAEAMGLSTPIMRTLAILSVIDGILIRELAIYAVVEQSTLSRVLEKMHACGLIDRKTDGSDGRATRIFLTPDGRTRFNAVWPVMAASYEQMFQGISDDDRRKFITVLQKMLINIRKNKV